MRVLFFGTYDERTHPRVQVLREGLAARGAEVDVCNAPLGVGTADRVAMVKRPWRALAFGLRVASAWIVLLWRSRNARRPDVVVVGYLGQFDVHLADLRFRRSTIVLDYMVGLGDTARDRRLDTRCAVMRLLDGIDRAARRAADVVLVDTEEQAALADSGGNAVVVPVGAPSAWHQVQSGSRDEGPLRVVFFGLYAPLQGAPVIGEAIAALGRQEQIAFTMVGYGQDLERTRELAGDGSRVEWCPWVDAADLPALVGGHDVCLGIFGTGDKALRVVPNKVYQGAAAGCAIVTSDTPCQRRALDGVGLFVPPGDANALAATLTDLASDPEHLARIQTATLAWANRRFAPTTVTEPLLATLRDLQPDA
jgi:glycosyltransferase involved in cell wall biosynthesis